MRYLDYLHPLDPRRLTLEVIAVCGITEPPVDEQVILEYFDIALFRTPITAIPGCESLAPLEHKLSGLLVKYGGAESPALWANPRMSHGRFRWTVSHEVGHLDLGHEGTYFFDGEPTLRPAMGRPESLPTDYRQVGYQGVLLDAADAPAHTFQPVLIETPESLKRKRQERDANHYAAELLMPAPMFFPEARDLPVGIQAVNQLCERYDASFEATAIRYAQACPERCAVFAAEPVLDNAGAVASFDVAYCIRGRSPFLRGLRQGNSLPFAGLLSAAWTAEGPVQGSVTADLLSLGSRATVAVDALRLGQHNRLVAIIWLESGQMPMLEEEGYA